MVARYMELLKFIFVVFMLTECFHSTKAMGLCEFAEKFPCEDNEGAISLKCSGYKKQTPSKPTDRVITKSPLCPPNMVYANCTTCQRSCMDPNGCITNCTETTTCVCPTGFLFKGDDCVLAEECDCFVEGEVVPEGGFYVNANCTRRGVCNNSRLIWDNIYKCNSDCLDVYNTGFTDSGVYTISPTNWPRSPFQVYCNMTDGGGWTSFQRRVDGSVDFYRNWNSYKEGFGSTDHEFWLGNDKLYYLTNQKNYTLRIDLVSLNGSSYFAKFDSFKINNEDDKYRLSQLGSYSGTADFRGSIDPSAGVALFYHISQQFSTYDQDNDDWPYECAKARHGAWWYRSCIYSNLNGDYNNTSCGQGNGGILWSYLPDSDCNVKFIEMKIRPN